MNVLLADDHGLLLEGLQNLLSANGISVVGLARNGLQAIDLARQLQPDVILMDLRMPECDGLTATRRITAEVPAAKVIILTTSDDEQDLFEAVKCGAFGYLVKSMDTDQLIACLEQVQHGIPPFSPGMAAKLLTEFVHLAATGPSARPALATAPPALAPERTLTDRQREVLSLIAQGQSYKDAGRSLGVSPRTIKYHMAEIMSKLHLAHRSQALAYAGHLGLGQSPPSALERRRRRRWPAPYSA